MFGRRQTDQLLVTLRAENSDLRAQLRLEREQRAEEHLKLVDRILALSAPGALREARRVPSPSPEPQAGPVSSQRGRLHFPGHVPYLRPPSPATPPTVPGRTPLTDSQIEAITQVRDLPEAPDA